MGEPMDVDEDDCNQEGPESIVCPTNSMDDCPREKEQGVDAVIVAPVAQPPKNNIQVLKSSLAIVVHEARKSRRRLKYAETKLKETSFELVALGLPLDKGMEKGSLDQLTTNMPDSSAKAIPQRKSRDPTVEFMMRRERLSRAAADYTQHERKVMLARAALCRACEPM